MRNSINLTERITASVQAIRQQTQLTPSVGIILGTGLGRLAKEISADAIIPYNEIPGFLVSTVEGHAGRLILGELESHKVVAMQGRFHYYEGYEMADITYPVRVMKALGVGILIVSNACGGLNPLFQTGDIMAITDHINLLGANPLRGPNDPKHGPRFPDMHNLYDKELVKLAESVAMDLKIPLRQGVYVAVAGPNLETAAEMRMCRMLGADVVGMSTVPEVIVARHIGLKVAGFSVITDMALADAIQPVSLEDVISAAHSAEPKLTALIRELVRRI